MSHVPKPVEWTSPRAPPSGGRGRPPFSSPALGACVWRTTFVPPKTVCASRSTEDRNKGGRKEEGGRK